MVPLTVTEALAEYAEEAGKQPAADVRRFLEWQAEGQNRDLAGYLAQLVKAGKARGTADKVRREVQAFYRYHGLKAPKAKGWRYDPRKEGTHEAVSLAMASAMIREARASLPPHLRAMLCLSTVYGLRAGEIAGIGPGQLDFDGGRLYVDTEKDGRPCWQHMPPEVAQHMRDWQGPQETSRVQAGFRHVWAAVSDEPKPKQLGWHALRRTLVISLRRAGVSDPAIGHFMRWAGGGERDAVARMVEWYGDPSATVGEEERAAEHREGAREEDAEVWDRHPLTGAWR